MADVAQLVAMGARHITFGDPDFLNGPHHALRAIDAVHGAFPELTFDVTVKVEHILRHRELWPRWGRPGASSRCRRSSRPATTSSSSSTRATPPREEAEAVAVLRAAGIEPRPSLLPFTPWTRPEDVFALLDLVARCDLVGNVDPVQYAIRLLVPPGSLLVTSGRLEGDSTTTTTSTWDGRGERPSPGSTTSTSVCRDRRSAAASRSGPPGLPTTPCAPPLFGARGAAPRAARPRPSPTHDCVRRSRPTSGRG